MHGATRDLGIAGACFALENLLGHPAGVVPVTRVRADEAVPRPASRDWAERAAARCEAGSAGLPVGVRVAARPWREAVALAALGAIEAAVRARGDGFRRPPAVRSAPRPPRLSAAPRSGAPAPLPREAHLPAAAERPVEVDELGAGS